jgi:hypothetical protein
MVRDPGRAALPKPGTIAGAASIAGNFAALIGYGRNHR